MGFEAAFREFMHQVVTVEPWISQDDYGNAIYGPPSSYKARVVGRQRMVRSAIGEEVISSKTIYLNGPVELSIKDRLRLPSGEEVTIFAIAHLPDEEGDHHTVVYTGDGVGAPRSTGT
jgi:hypothetical protein